MKKIFIPMIALACLVVPVILFAQSHASKPKNGYVPDQITAVKIAEAVLVPIYGEKIINEEKPFKAVLRETIWVVEGNSRCPVGEHCMGGVAFIEISRDDGRILGHGHGE